jgi:hypothetical protein
MNSGRSDHCLEGIMDNRSSIHFTLYFNGQFWAGVFERLDGEAYAVSRFLFGQEPSDAELLDFILGAFPKLEFFPAAPGETVPVQSSNPKRRQREAALAVRRGVGTKAQEALRQQFELGKARAKEERGLQWQERQERQFQLRQEKRKLKKRGH